MQRLARKKRKKKRATLNYMILVLPFTTLAKARRQIPFTRTAKAQPPPWPKASPCIINIPIVINITDEEAEGS